MNSLPPSPINAEAVVLPVERHRVAIELRGRGRLVPWMGPAFRGITALRHRAAECHQPRETWRTTWQYCRGCPLMAGCAYGELFEPDATDPSGSRDAPRPLVIAPAFPIPTRAIAGERFPLDIVAIGPAAASVPGVLRALADAGRFDGLGPDRVFFDVIPSGPPARTLIAAADLPKAAAPLPVVRHVTIRLGGPLFLRDRNGPGVRRQVELPSLGHLLRASMRVAREFLGDAALCPGRGHLDLDDLANTIEPSTAHVAPFTQEKASHRSRERFGLVGVTGSWTFESLPACLVPWLHLGGLIHVGGHRIAGAGGWDLDFGANDKAAEMSP